MSVSAQRVPFLQVNDVVTFFEKRIRDFGQDDSEQFYGFNEDEERI